MDIRSTITALSNTTARYEAAFVAAQTRHEALNRYTTIADLKSALALSSNLSDADRQALCLALIAEAQRNRSPLWQALLCIAFEALLHRLARPWKRDEDAGQRAITGLLEAIRTIDVQRPPERLALHLYGTAARLGFSDLAAEKRAPKHVEFDEEVHAPPCEGAAPARTELAALRRLLPAKEADTVMAALLATKATGESLHRYTDRVYASRSAAERKRLCGWLRPRMAKALALVQREYGKPNLCRREVRHEAA